MPDWPDYSQPTSVIRQRWQLAKEAGGWWWWSLKGPTYYWYTGLTAIGRIKCQLGGHRVDNSYVMESAEPFSPRGPSSRVPICHKCAQEMIVRGCFARLVALLRQFPPRPNIHSAQCALCCVVQVAHVKGNGVAPCGGGVLRRRALLPLLSTPT